MSVTRRLLGHPELVIGCLALAASASGLANGYVYDDLPIVLQNSLVHHLGNSAQIWQSAYWPAGLLYRPVTMQLFALEWALGSGRSLVFHSVNVLLMLGVAVLFWRLARRWLEPFPALGAAALFAVHPVHVESVGNVVGQAELLATGIAFLVVERYLAWRDEGGLSLLRRILLAGLTLVAILCKETGYVIPILLVAAELVGARGASAWRARLRAMLPVLVWQTAVVIGAVLLRIIIMGPTLGAGPAAALRDLSTADRIVGMLAVVPEWVRLLLWPAHLQAEYGPPAVPVTGQLAGGHWLGLAILLAALVALVVGWRRNRAVAYGLAWTAIALLPVSNILTTTGVIVAERTLFLPSAGAMLALGGVLGVVARSRVAFALLGLAVLAGAIRSAERQLVWREQGGFFRRLEADAPTTYRAHLVASTYYSDTGQWAAAERAAQRAWQLYRGDPQVFEQYGQALRRLGRCAEALPLLAEGVGRFPDRTVARSRLIECALAVGDTSRARAVATEGVRSGYLEFEQTLKRLSRTPAGQP